MIIPIRSDDRSVIKNTPKRSSCRLGLNILLEFSLCPARGFLPAREGRRNYSLLNSAKILSEISLNSSSVSFSLGLEKSMSFSFCIGTR